MSHKTALVLSGWWCAISFSTGILFSLLDHYHLEDEHIDMVFAWSAWCSLSVFFLCDLIDDRKKRWIDIFDSKELVNPWRLWKIFDIDYLVYEVYKHQFGITSESLQHAADEIPFYMGMTQASSWKATLYEAHDRDTLELVRASMALPVVYGREVPILGKRYFDGVFSQSPEFLIHEAFSHWADDVIVIDPWIYKPKSNYIQQIWTYSRSSEFRNQFYQDEEMRRALHEMYGLPNDGIHTCYDDHILFIAPTKEEFLHTPIDITSVTVKTSILQWKVHWFENDLIRYFLWRVV